MVLFHQILTTVDLVGEVIRILSVKSLRLMEMTQCHTGRQAAPDLEAGTLYSPPGPLSHIA